ncbi:MAG: FAD-binding oxidoreductase [Rhodobacteraceae bacterium]|nr:FAD-binding oxidoreductase [Paracoccaceae bacterium]
MLSKTRNIPYWWLDAPRPPEQPQDQPASVDVAIVGAGFTGLNTALVVARAGVSVAVFESGQLGEGASTRNGGMIGPSFHKLGIDGLRAKYGLDRTNDIIRESIGFVDYLDTFLKTEGIAAGFERNGRFRGALRPKHYDDMQRQLESLQKACGLEGFMVPQKDQAVETGSQRFFGGVVYTTDGGLHPAKYHDGLVARVNKAGALILPHTPVENIDRAAWGYVISTPKGKTRATHVAICTNGYTTRPFAGLRRRVLPLRSAMIATAPIDPTLMCRFMPKNRIYGDSRRMVAYYRPSPDGKRILFGGRATGIRDEPTRNAAQLRTSMIEIYPELRDVPIENVWSGLVAYTFDHAPHIGQREGLYYAMGYCGSGVARSSYFGNKLGHKILGNAEGVTAFDDLGFDSKPLYTGNPWFMPALLTWHRIADRWGL